MKRLLVVFFGVLVLFSNICVPLAMAKESEWPLGPKPSNISAESAIVMEVSTGLILYEKNIHKEHFPASITKIMTTLLALENSSLGETVTFSHDAVFGIESGSSHIGIDENEQLTMEQSLYGIMLESANEVSLGVAEHIGGTIEQFALLMNKKAKELGCKNTHFTNPNGLHDEQHYTSAYDMALISRAAYQNPTFKKITSTKRYDIPPTNKQKETRYLRNHHQMLNPYSYIRYQYEYCRGGKTGYTSDSLWTLVTFAEKDGMELVCVVMRAQGPNTPQNEYSDTIDLLNYSFEKYHKYPIGSQEHLGELESPFFTRFHSFFDKSKSPLKISKDASVILPVNVDYQSAKRTVHYDPSVKLVKGDNIIGQVTYTYAGKTVGSSNIIYQIEKSPRLVSSTPVEKLLTESRPEKKITTFWKTALVIIIMIITFGGILIYRNHSIRKNSFSYYKRRKGSHKRSRF